MGTVPSSEDGLAPPSSLLSLLHCMELGNPERPEPGVNSCCQRRQGWVLPATVTTKHPGMNQILLCTHPWVQHFGARGQPRVSSSLLSGSSPGHKPLCFLRKKTSKFKKCKGMRKKRE